MMENDLNQPADKFADESAESSAPASPVKPPPEAVQPVSVAWWLAVLLVLGTLVLYWPATGCGFVDLDDADYVTSNLHVQAGLSWQGVEWAFVTGHAVNWHPLTWLSLMLDEDLFGRKAAGFHFSNLALHAANVGLLFWLLRRLTGATWRSALVAGLFGWHPVHVESVAWVSERKDVLSTFFGFVALLFYERYARGVTGSGEATEEGRGFYRSPSYWLAWFCLALGLMSKPMLVTWPLVMLLLDYWPLGRGRAGGLRSLLLEKIPFLALVVASSVVTFLVQKHGGAVVPMQNLPLDMRASNALISYCRYLGELFWPSRLAVFYPYHGYWPAIDVLLALIFLGGMSVVVLACRGGLPFLLLGWFWFMVTLVPVIGLVQVGEQSMADRYTYIPSVGIFMLMVWSAAGLARRWRPLRLPVWGLGAVAVLACVVLARRQLGYWHDSEALFQHAIAVTKDNSRAHNGLGIVYASEGRVPVAISQFQQALRLEPRLSDAHYNLGLTLMFDGQTTAAIAEFQEAIQLSPGLAVAHENLGLIAVRQGRKDEAAKEFQEALHYNPDNPSFHRNAGNLLASQGRPDAAIKEYKEALRLAPDNGELYYSLGDVLNQQGETEAAMKQFQSALHYKPDLAVAHYALGLILARKGQTDGAIDQFKEVLRIDPNYPNIHDNLGLALAGKGQSDAAMSQFQQALRLNPGDAILHDNVGNCLARTGHDSAAIDQFRDALQLKPDYAKAHDNLGVVLARQGHKDEAIRELQEAVRLSPNLAKARDDLGFVLAGAGRAKEAMSQFHEALRLNPQDAFASTNLASTNLASAGQSEGNSTGTNASPVKR